MKASVPAKPSVPCADPPKSNSIRMDLARLQKLLDLLDGKEAGKSKTHRKFVRWPFRHLCVSLNILHQDGSRSTMGVACRNISCGGLSFLHNSYMYPQSPCEITLPHVAGDNVIVPGKIARCGHVQGIIHEVGIKFEAPIRISDFVNQGRQADALCIEKVDSESLRGSILFVGGSEMDQQVVRHYLRATALRVSWIHSVPDTIKRASEGLDLIFLDSEFDTSVEPPVITRLRDEGINCPIVALMSGASPNSLHPSTRIKCDAIIAKPITEVTLHQVIAGLIRPEGRKGLFESSLDPNDPSRCLVHSFTEETRRQADRLQEAMAKNDTAACISLCRQIGGVAPVVGFDLLGELARKAEFAVATSGSSLEAAPDLKRLISSCRRVRAA